MKALLVIGVVAGLALAACGGGSNASITQVPTAAPAAAVTQAAAPVAPAATQAAPAATQAAPAATQAASNTAPRKVILGATNDRYSISTLEVKPGEKIEFVLTNSGDEKHNLVGVGQGVSLVSPDFDSGQTVSWIWTAPSTPMTFKFQCSFHANVPPIQVTVK